MKREVIALEVWCPDCRTRYVVGEVSSTNDDDVALHSRLKAGESRGDLTRDQHTNYVRYIPQPYNL
jgi:hypothetical protein